MRALRRFTVRASLPEPLSALSTLATNLRWTWHPPTQELFSSIDSRVWSEVGGDPLRLLSVVAAGRLDDARERRAVPPQAARARVRPRAVRQRRALVPAPPGRDRRAPRARVERHTAAHVRRVLLDGVRRARGAAELLGRPRHPRRRPPQGGQRPRRAVDRGRPALPLRLLPPVALARRLADRALPDARPARSAAGAAHRAVRAAAARPRRHARRPDAARQDLEGAGRPHPAVAARLRRRAERRGPARRHGPALRRRPEPPHPPGDPRRHRRCPGGAHVLRADRPRAARGVPHQRGPRGLPRHRADPRVHHQRRPRLRPGADGRARRCRVHHAHARARRYRPLPGRPRAALLRGRAARARREHPAHPRARRRGQPRHVQHGPHGPAAGPARERRVQTAR